MAVITPTVNVDGSAALTGEDTSTVTANNDGTYTLAGVNITLNADGTFTVQLGNGFAADDTQAVSWSAGVSGVTWSSAVTGVALTGGP